jgi:hypothetical protein
VSLTLPLYYFSLYQLITISACSNFAAHRFAYAIPQLSYHIAFNWIRDAGYSHALYLTNAHYWNFLSSLTPLRVIGAFCLTHPSRLLVFFPELMKS